MLGTDSSLPSIAIIIDKATEALSSQVPRRRRYHRAELPFRCGLLTFEDLCPQPSPESHNCFTPDVDVFTLFDLFLDLVLCNFTLVLPNTSTMTKQASVQPAQHSPRHRSVSGGLGAVLD